MMTMMTVFHWRMVLPIFLLWLVVLYCHPTTTAAFVPLLTKQQHRISSFRHYYSPQQNASSTTESLQQRKASSSWFRRQKRGGGPPPTTSSMEAPPKGVSSTSKDDDHISALVTNTTIRVDFCASIDWSKVPTTTTTTNTTTWLAGKGLLTVSLAKILQQDILMTLLTPVQAAILDWDWKYAVLRLNNNADSDSKDWMSVLTQGISNSHPLGISMVQANSSKYNEDEEDWQVFPALSMVFCMTGSCTWDILCSSMNVAASECERLPWHSLGTPLSDFHNPPTVQELEWIVGNWTVPTLQSPDEQQIQTQQIRADAGTVVRFPIGCVVRHHSATPDCRLLVVGPGIAFPLSNDNRSI